ncbi:MAG: NADH-quinone oxidoreductase subunit G [Epsilonproteobacteria bacterium]|nr:NADH-quinone oxidoreductase subunit G [Campylobacterota bacterium]
MSDLITVIIDGKECQAKDGEYVLNVARANEIFIPAICYLTRCSPTLACRLCLVESGGKQIYACNAKVKDGMEITTKTENIEVERRAIMEVYDVNHPLQCGVCDQSGECELQNYTLYMGVDKQNYAVKDVLRDTKNWGVMSYDPGLCIVCEKCVTVCKDMIGSNALGTTSRGSEALDKSYKDNMPKDAYSMWNKLNKNLISFEEDKCIDCGECIAVCPVGALVSTDFKYTTNAWELTKVPAANPYSSDCSLMYYEVKHTSIKDETNKIYRVTNDSHYTSLSGAARFGFDYSNRVTSKDSIAFNRAVEAFKNCDSIIFNSFITNEEAMILQKIKEKLNIKLVNNDAFKYNKFLNNFASISGSSLYSGDLNTLHDSNFVVSVGTYFKSDAPSVRYGFNNSISLNKGAGLYFHPLGDKTVEDFGKKGKTIETVFHAPLSEDAILYLILDQFGKNLPANTASYLESLKETKTKTITEVVKEKVTEIVKDEESGEEKEITKEVSKKVTKEVSYQTTKLIEMIGSDNSLLETIASMNEKKDSYTLVIGEDLYGHPNSEDLAKLCGMIEKYTDFSVVIIPSQTNTLGVSMICELDEKATGKTVGYNMKADVEISALGDGDLDMPALNQQEGTFVNINKRVVPTNAAVGYNGYELNDIANAILDRKMKYTIDYTSEIFEKIPFEKLENYFTNAMEEKRGYKLLPNCVDCTDSVASATNHKLEGIIIYNANPINQFNEFTAAAKQLEYATAALYVSKDFMEKLGFIEADMVEIETQNGVVTLQVAVDNQLIGDISYVPTFEKNCKTKNLFGSYRFITANLKKV